MQRILDLIGSLPPSRTGEQRVAAATCRSVYNKCISLLAVHGPRAPSAQGLDGTTKADANRSWPSNPAKIYM